MHVMVKAERKLKNKGKKPAGQSSITEIEHYYPEFL